MAEVRNAQKKTYGVQDVGLSAAVQSRDGVEERVEAVDLRPLRVRLKPLDDDGLDVHICVCPVPADPGGDVCEGRGPINVTDAASVCLPPTNGLT